MQQQAAGSNSKAGLVMLATIDRVQAMRQQIACWTECLGQLHTCRASTVMQGLTAQTCGMHDTMMAKTQEHCMHANDCSHDANPSKSVLQTHAGLAEAALLVVAGAAGRV